MAESVIKNNNHTFLIRKDLTFQNGQVDVDITSVLSNFGLSKTSSSAIVQLDSGNAGTYGVHATRISNGTLRVTLTDSSINATVGCIIILGSGKKY